MKLSPRVLVLALPVVFLSCADNQGVTSVKTSARPLFDLGQNLPLVYDVENTGASFASMVPTFDQSPSNLILPDPFRLFNGTIDVSFSGWERRRAEIIASIEKYEVGPKPDPSDVTETATFAANTLRVVVTRKSNGQSLTLKAPIFLPAGSGPFPAMIAMTYCFPPPFDRFFPCRPNGFGSLPADILTSRNVAGIAYFHDQVTSYYGGFGTLPNFANDAYFRLYPEYSIGAGGNIGQYSAWAWGVSRLIDGIQIAARDGTLPIDVHHLGVTGCSYAGKMALFAGALDERVALTIAQESGGGGMPSWRPSTVLKDPRGDVERFVNTDGRWFINGMRAQFNDANIFKLPHDHHELMALVAPRGLLATNNYDFIWLSNPSAWISGRAAEETYKQLGIGDRFGYIDDGSLTGNPHNHCSVPTSQRPAIEAFVEKFLLGHNADTEIAAAHVSPYTDSDVDTRGWMPWALRNDVNQLVAAGAINAGVGNALTAKVNDAVSDISIGDNVTGLEELNAFANQVNALVNSRRLTQAQADVLIAKVNSTRTRLGF